MLGILREYFGELIAIYDNNEREPIQNDFLFFAHNKELLVDRLATAIKHQFKIPQYCRVKIKTNEENFSKICINFFQLFKKISKFLIPKKNAKSSFGISIPFFGL